MECAKARSAVTSTASMPRRNPVGEMSFRSAKLTSLWPTPAPDIVHLMCDLCRDSWKPWIHRQYVQLARDLEKHAELCRCAQCGALYEVFADDLAPPGPLTTDEARARFPGSL